MFISQLTGQFPHCGNAFRMDTYKSCSFGCVYCFSSARGGNHENNTETVTEEQFKKIQSYIGGNVKNKSVVNEMIQRRVPIHFGGMSDPFQPIEFNKHISLKMINLLKEYPVMFSTKTDYLPEEYFDVLNPAYHVFQISCSGFPCDKIRAYEKATPTTNNRLAFAKQLKDRGFTVFIRIQPLVKIQWAQYVIEQVGKIVDGVTIEHLKIPDDNHAVFKLLCGLIVNEGLVFKFSHSGREYEYPTEIKEKNINKLKDMERTCKIMVGDNDLRLLSETINCCGLDICPPSFSNWIRYNSMAIKITGDRSVWHPKIEVRCRGEMGYGLNSESMVKGRPYSEYVERNYAKHYGDINQHKLF